MAPGPELDTGHSQGTKQSLHFRGAHLPLPSGAVNKATAGEKEGRALSDRASLGPSQRSRRQKSDWAD